MEFYTNIAVRGDNIYVRGIKDGVSYQHKCDFSPTMYVSNNGKVSEWRTLDGNFVVPIQPGTIRDTKEFIKKYEGVSGFSVCGQNNYSFQYISDIYRNRVNFDTSLVRVFFIDIETSTEEGFPDIVTANEEILLITIYDSKHKLFTTFGSKPFENKFKDVKYVLCNNEQHLLKEFMVFLQHNYPDIITGWNSDLFDISYLARRIERILGKTTTSKLSPWGWVKEKIVSVNGKDEFSYEIPGIANIDYMAAYKKFARQKLESYRLDFVAQHELDDKKLENPYDNFKDFYTKAWQTFVEYNIHDTRIVVQLEEKLKFLEIVIGMAYNAKVNYEDALSPVRMWDAIFYNYLKTKKIAIPLQDFGSSKSEKFAGAYVRDPIIGAHKYIVSFDLQSLYPHLFMQYNISPETLHDVITPCTVEQLLNKEVDTSYVVENNLSLTASGWSYRKDIRGFIPDLMDSMFSERKAAKDKMLALEQEYEDDKTKQHLIREIDDLDNLQSSLKTSLVSAYGAIGCPYFRYFDIRMAESITLSGQLTSRWVANDVNRKMNFIMKTEDVDYVIYGDTDSLYISMEKMIEKFYPNATVQENIKHMDKICKDIFAPMIKKSFDNLCAYMNAYEQRMFMKREILADKGIWTGKKTYILNVHNSEGVQYDTPKLVVKGLAMVKSSTPAIIREQLKKSIYVILEGDEKKLQKYISDFKVEFDKLSIEDISFPRSVNGVSKYSGSPIYIKGTPIAVRGSLLFNHYIKKYKLDKQYQLIKNGDKIKYVYVKLPNPFNENIIAFPQKLPKEFKMEEYIDYDMQFEKSFLDAITTVVSPLGWTAVEYASLESFFG